MVRASYLQIYNEILSDLLVMEANANTSSAPTLPGSPSISSHLSSSSNAASTPTHNYAFNYSSNTIISNNYYMHVMNQTNQLTIREEKKKGIYVEGLSEVVR
jgi:hypothetical protein